MIQDFSYKTIAGNRMSISLYSRVPFGKIPAILYLHGFKGFKDWGFVPHMGEYFSARGFAFIAFNFSHNGIGSNPLEFTELDKFEQNTFSLELSESLELCNLIRGTNFFGSALRGGLGLLGHSRGGGVALLAGRRSAHVNAVCTWAAISKVDRFGDAMIRQWREQGYLEAINSRTGQVMRLSTALLDDIETNKSDKLNITRATAELGKPLLLIHGDADEAVPYFEGEELMLFADHDLSRFSLIPGAGHTFGAKHPFAGSPPELDMALSQSEDFFAQHLNP